MFNKLFPTFLVLLLLAALLVPGCKVTSGNTSSGTPSYGNKVSNLAYDFSLPDLKGNTVTLSSLSGRPVLLNFWYTG